MLTLGEEIGSDLACRRSLDGFFCCVMAEFDLPTWVEFDLNGPSKFGCSDSGNDFELKK